MMKVSNSYLHYFYEKGLHIWRNEVFLFSCEHKEHLIALDVNKLDAIFLLIGNLISENKYEERADQAFVVLWVWICDPYFSKEDFLCCVILAYVYIMSDYI
jgi:hypothetical protein